MPDCYLYLLVDAGAFYLISLQILLWLLMAIFVPPSLFIDALFVIRNMFFTYIGVWSFNPRDVLGS